MFLSLSIAFAGEDISFYDLYSYDLMSKMKGKLAKGKCIDIKKHFLSSIKWVGFHDRGSEWKHKTRTVKEAISFCKSNKDVPLCDSLDDLISLNQRALKDKKREDSLHDHKMLEVIHSISRKDLVTLSFIDKTRSEKMGETSIGSCLEGREAYLSFKFFDVLTSKIYEGDDSLATRVIYKYEGMRDSNKIDYSEMDEVNDMCLAGMKEAKELLLSEYTHSIKSGCLASLAKQGLSIYDKKEIYCSGKTPLACSLYSRAPASK